jgi:hypothetical protein
MKKINFVKTFIPESQYKQKYSLGNTIVYHIGTTFNNEQNTYECYECTVPASIFDEDMVKSAFSEFIDKIKALQLKQAKAEKITEITAYDKSSSVNSFILNDKLRWLDIDLRKSLSYSTEILKEDGEKTVDIWFDTECETMNIDNALYMLKELEVYAKQTNNITHQHKAEVETLTTIEEVKSYDITKGYPDKLVFSNEKLSEMVSNL